MSNPALPKKTTTFCLPSQNGIDSLVLKEYDVPDLEPQVVLVKVEAVSLNFRDVIIVNGRYPMHVKEDLVITSDMAGSIIAVGDEVGSRWKIGDRVMANFNRDHIAGLHLEEYNGADFGGPIDGMLTQYKVLPIHCLVRVPEHLTFEEASTLPCAALAAYDALMGPRPLKGGQTVLLEGTGGTSIFGLQIATAAGATTIVTSSSDEKLEIARKLGATHTINYKTHPDWNKEVMRITNGRGVDHTVEVGGAGTLAKAANATRYGGSIGLIGIVAGQGNMDSLVVDVILRSIVLHGSPLGARVLFEDMSRVFETHKIRPHVDRVFPFRETKAALKYLESQKHVGKVVIKLDEQ